MNTLLFMNKTVFVPQSSAPRFCCSVLIYLISCGQLLAVGSEGDEASGQVDQTANLQVGVGAAGGRRADRVCSIHHVAVTPLHTAAKIKAGK